MSAAERLISRDVSQMPLDVPLGDDALSIATLPLAEEGDVEIGLWEAGPGSDNDTEVDEFFIVLQGRGHVEFSDGSRIDLRPGTMIRLHAGDETTWVISERLRKLYVASA